MESAAERRRRRARLEISRTAVRLFAERGYATTTTKQVAAAADVSRSTLFRHFADKDDLVFGVEDDLLVVAQTAVTEATAGQAPWVALRHATATIAADIADLRDVLLDRERVVATSPALQARAAGKHGRWEACLAEALQAGYQMDAADAGLMAKAAVACFEVAERQWMDNQDSSLAVLVDTAFKRLPAVLRDAEQARS